MEKTTIKDGTRIEFAGQAGHTTLYTKGWYDVSLDNGTFAKARRKDLVVLDAPAEMPVDLPDPEDRCPKCGNRNRSCTCGQALEPYQAIERSWANDDQIEVFCPECEHVWTPKRLKLSIQCPKCGAWVKVRIKADLTHYIRGLGVTPSGHDTLDIGDGTADILRGLTAAEAIDVTAAELVRLGIETMSKSFRKAFAKAIVGGSWCENNLRFFLTQRYSGRNNGMVRMNCGNILRAAQIRAEGQK